MFEWNSWCFMVWTNFRVEAVQMTFVIIGACMAALGLMILTVGCLATGATRYKVYRAWRSRVGGRISCAVVCTHIIFVVVFNKIYYSLWVLHMCYK